MYQLDELTVNDYLEKMAVCDFPGPAAGSAAATTAAMAAALMEMSCDGSLRKSNGNPLLEESIKMGKTIRKRCQTLANVDMEAYGEVIKAAKQKGNDPEAYELAMKNATEPFIEILRSCHDLLNQIEKIVGMSFSKVLGDLVGGTYLAEAAAAASKSGIEVNMVHIKDQAFKEMMLPEARLLYKQSNEAKERILHHVFK